MRMQKNADAVSILVLMDLCIKTLVAWYPSRILPIVSILVLMDLCIKTSRDNLSKWMDFSFNPCFNGSMYKNLTAIGEPYAETRSFNPCFNGSMYKNLLELGKFEPIEESFNPCFNGSMYKNAFARNRHRQRGGSFNPCFNGSMYKNQISVWKYFRFPVVSILVLMDLCIKTNLFT